MDWRFQFIIFQKSFTIMIGCSQAIAAPLRSSWASSVRSSFALRDHRARSTSRRHFRVRAKTACDVYGRPVPLRQLWIAREVEPSPVCVCPADVAPREVVHLLEFEKEHGRSIRGVPEYSGLRRGALRSALSKRTAISLASTRTRWVPAPILVSEKVMRLWVARFGCRERLVPRLYEDPVPMPSNHAEVEENYGSHLRRYVALGFVGRRVVEAYLREMGVSVRECVVRQWYDH